MKVLIVEDETAASKNLIKILEEIDSAIEIAGITESVKQTILWLQQNPSPDLILMDIHLSDGSAFTIFNSIRVEIPVIFVTAYDQYAIDAFKVNSIDYLLKPIDSNDLRFALDKFKKYNTNNLTHFINQLSQFLPAGKYLSKILVPYNDSLIPVSVADISCFYTTNNSTRIYLKSGKYYPYSKTLENIQGMLSPAKFFRANKQYIISKESVNNITIWPDSRLLITLTIEIPEQLFISKNKASDFKQWMVFPETDQ